MVKLHRYTQFVLFMAGTTYQEYMKMERQRDFCEGLIFNPPTTFHRFLLAIHVSK